MTLHAVRICQDAAAGNDEATGATGVLALTLPRQAEVGLAVNDKHLMRESERLAKECAGKGEMMHLIGERHEGPAVPKATDMGRATT